MAARSEGGSDTAWACAWPGAESWDVEWVGVWAGASSEPCALSQSLPARGWLRG